MKPLETFEKWLYTSMALWIAAFVWLGVVVWPEHPFVPVFDSVVAFILTAGAAITAVASFVLSRRP